ncbi:histidine kinase OS=Streptomyces albaduncus OX=68172 GN=FHS32_004709 PE=4 SV=1 [Streptomyces griseoloalbus]
MAVQTCPAHRFDVCAALAGLLGGLLLWGVGLATRPADEPIVLFDGRWPILLPLAVTAGCDPPRRTSPRTALIRSRAAR